MKRVEMDELEKVQSIAKHAVEVLSLDAFHRKIEIKATIVLKDMDPAKKESY